MNENNHKTISFYKYVKILDPEKFRDLVRDFCKEKGILGRILIGKEGLNGACSGKKNNIESFKEFLLENSLFTDLTFREQETSENSYHKLVIKVRDEIVAFGKEVNLENKGSYVTPGELHEMYEKDEEFVIIDARNDYETKIGKFENAVEIPIRNFRDLPDHMNELKELKNKKIVMYCTGGIRCEKSSAYLKEQGFKDVNHLKGGIIAYTNYVKDKNKISSKNKEDTVSDSKENEVKSHFKGTNFVFDDRLIDDDSCLLVDCEICSNNIKEKNKASQKSDSSKNLIENSKQAKHYINCHNLDCDKLYACCDHCKEELNECCSIECANSPRQRQKKEKPKKIIGKVENYYTKAKVAFIKIEKEELDKNSKIFIKGKTTNLKIEINEMRNNDGEIIDKAFDEYITVPVTKRVRKNDRVMVLI